MANGHSDPHICKPECDHKVEYVKYLTQEVGKIQLNQMFDQVKVDEHRAEIEARYATTRLPALRAELREACKQLRRDVNDTLDAIEEYVKLQEDFARKPTAICPHGAMAPQSCQICQNEFLKTMKS